MRARSQQKQKNKCISRLKGFFSFGFLCVLKVYHGHCTSYIMHYSRSSLLVMTSFWHVKFTQLDGFVRDRSRNIRCETLQFACRATFECCCFTCSRGEVKQCALTQTTLMPSLSLKLIFIKEECAVTIFTYTLD